MSETPPAKGRDPVSIAIPIIVTTICTLLGIMTGGISVWSFLSARVEEKTKLEMRVQSLEMFVKSQKDDLWILDGKVLREIESNHVKHDVITERLIRLEINSKDQ